MVWGNGGAATAPVMVALARIAAMEMAPKSRRMGCLQRPVRPVSSPVGRQMDGPANLGWNRRHERLGEASIDHFLRPRMARGSAAGRSHSKVDRLREALPQLDRREARLAELKAKAQRRADQVDAGFAAGDANMAEADAYDAIDARVYADERAAALV